MVAASTGYKHENTFYPAAPAAPTRIDYMCVPADFLKIVTSCHVAEKIGRQLQLIPDSRPRDHLPILLKCNYLLTAPQPAVPTQICVDSLMAAWKGTKGRAVELRETFRSKVSQLSEAKEQI